MLTPEHLRYWFATHLGKIGVKMEAEKLDPHEVGPPVKLSPRAAWTSRTDNARLLLARQSPGMLGGEEILAEGLSSRAAAFMLDYTPQGVTVRTMIDGVWIPREPRTREAGDPGAGIAQAALRFESAGSPEPTRRNVCGRVRVVAVMLRR